MSRRTVAGSPAIEVTGSVPRSPAGVPFGFSAPLGAAVVAAACLCAGAFPSAAAARLWLPAAAVAAVAFLSRDWRAGLAVAGVAFLLVDGFLENRSGLLTWHPGDGARLGLLLCVAVLGAALGAVASSPARDGGAS
ncbi:hypothetical protein [Kineosporia sp. R_H_3]|uniref:hypothetical protein n=1 Tax=Kineosporia sp. R_H_3 TaxID=1961848 RepID=UPI00117B5E74|nr:hypothetical protein [Kineosporia sp. R_H_3]